MMIKRILLLLLGIAGIGAVGFLIYRRINTDPLVFLMGVIGAAATLAVVFQLLKDW